MTEETTSESSASTGESQQSASDESQQIQERPPSPPVGVSWLDQDEQLRQLWIEKKPPEEISSILGRSIAAIMTRAARLGLPRRAAPGRKRGYKRTDVPRRKVKASSSPRIRVRAAVHDTTEEEKAAQARIQSRVCLMCLNKFQSLGAFNRICSSCKGSADYVKGSSTPDFSFKVMG